MDSSIFDGAAGLEGREGTVAGSDGLLAFVGDAPARSAKLPAPSPAEVAVLDGAEA